MEVLDPGHMFLLDVLDGYTKIPLIFVKRDDPSEKYPGNVGHYSGTTIQEVLRATISRVLYLDNQMPSWQNKHLLKHLRDSIECLEDRNSEKKGGWYKISGDTRDIEDLPTCPKCLHINCKDHQEIES